MTWLVSLNICVALPVPNDPMPISAQAWRLSGASLWEMSLANSDTAPAIESPSLGARSREGARGLGALERPESGAKGLSLG